MHSNNERIAVYVRLRVVLVTAICLSSSSLLFAENPYVHDGSIGDETNNVAASDQPKTLGPSDRRPVGQWIGERFIFMQMQKEVRDVVSKQLHINVKDYEGRIAKVIDVTRSKADPQSWKVKLAMEDNSRILVLSYHEGFVEGILGIAPVMDIDDAKEKWLGKTLWCKQDYLFSYGADKERARIPIKECSAVKVTDVVAGDYHQTPVRFIVRTDSGQEGFVDLRWSGTNSPVSSIYSVLGRLKDVFFVENPVVPDQAKKPSPSHRQLMQIKQGDKFIIQLLDKLEAPGIDRRLYTTAPASQKGFESLTEAPYALVSGKQATVSQVTSWRSVDQEGPADPPLMRSYDVVGFKVDGYENTVYYIGQISQMARDVALPLSEWNDAQKLVGKEVWKSRNNKLVMGHPTRFYYLPTGTRLLDRFVVQSVKLDSLFAGRMYGDEDSSFEFGVRNPGTGEEGSCHASIRQFLSDWYTEDPKKTHPLWSDDVWTGIRSGEPVVGMIAEQAKMVWGEPDEINTSKYEWGTDEQWVYNKKGYLYFENGKLTSLQTSRKTSID